MHYYCGVCAFSDMGLVKFYLLLQVLFLEDQIVVLDANVHGSTAARFSNLPVAEKAEAITEYFLVNSGYLQKELSV